MAYVRFSHTNTSGVGRDITVEAETDATWNMISTGQAGSATITVPSDSEALDPDFISTTGESWVRIFGHGGVGEWVGFVDRINEFPDRTIIIATEWWAMIQRIPVQQHRIFIHVTPAVIVKAAMGASPWGLLSFAEGIPDLERWEFRGESIWDHVQQMMEFSGQELYYDTDRQMHWGRRGGDSITDQLAVAPYDLVDASMEWDASESVSQVTVISNDEWYTARGNGLTSGRTAVIKEDVATAAMAARAENELVRRSEPKRSITGSLTEDRWSLQLGDTIGVFMPYANLGQGLMHKCRLVSRSFSDSRKTLDVRLQILSARSSAGIPNPLGGFKFHQDSSTTRRWQQRGHRYLGGKGESVF